MIAVFGAICSLFSAIVLLFVGITLIRQRGKWENISKAVTKWTENPDEMSDLFSEFIYGFNKWVRDPQEGENNVKALGENVQKLIVGPLAESLFMRFKGMMGGKAKGLNNQVKQLESGMLDQVIETGLGVPGMGNWAQGALEEHPWLGFIIAQAMKNKGSGLGIPGIGQLGGFNIGTPMPPNNSGNKPW